MSENSKVLALKYRPQVFEDLIGQQVIAETIKNSITSDKSPNAFLFTGIRGVGKTTFARIVAKSLNCEHGLENMCKNKCSNCVSITNSSHIDVLEMDAASKTGVDDVRELIEFSRYGPTTAKYKIFIIDEVHMLSKQAFNALLKTLEEPPKYLKFIFATTEIKKIPVTVISRCQRFDLSRVKSEELFNYIKMVKDKEGGNVSDDALRLIVKISEGSVRDALSLLDRGLVANQNDEELNLEKAQSIYGYFDKSSLIELIKNLLNGDEKKVFEKYRRIYETGVDPRIFLNDFLEVLYYLKNISFIKLDGNNFSLNDQDYKNLSAISESLDSKDIILFWQFTIDTIEEINIVSNPNLSVEMFLFRLMRLKGFKDKDNDDVSIKKSPDILSPELEKKINSKTVNQIKNISQHEKVKPKPNKNEVLNELKIDDFESLINLCVKKKEAKLKYELETNINLVSFSDGFIEISFNENLDKDFIKNLSHKLFEWTTKRWIISLSKNKGQISKKEKNKIDEKNYSMTLKNQRYINK
ncbi:DNA polymerase III subunit gamma/tau [Candidatus Pelagibacter sp.]|nr:DNA polymerase III subunit gamma/tau [Candidatus Pelagibacter sp.]